MGGFNENATEDLLKESQRVSRRWNREIRQAGRNSLLYEAFPQAKREKVAENLEELEKGLEQVENKLRNLGNSALQELAERLQRNLEQLPGLGEEELREEAKELAKAIGSMPNASKIDDCRIGPVFRTDGIQRRAIQRKIAKASAAMTILELVEQFLAECQTGFVEEKS